jgi:diguanylate cyclase (GGDEF)-like protein/PAS domain S-box-containing protein
MTALFAGHTTVGELAAACALSPASVRRHVSVLRRADLVVASGSDPVRYEVVEAGVERLFNDSNARLLGSVEQAGRRYWERLAAAAEYRAIFDGATVGILQLDLEGNCLTCNPAAERLFAAGAAQLSQLSSRRLLAEPVPEDPFISRSREREVRLRRPLEGTTFWASVSLAEVCDADGRPQYRYAMVEDLTERRRAEEALRESEHRFRTVFRQAGIGIAQLAPGGEVLEVNPALARMLGMLEPGIDGRPLAKYLRLDDSEPSFFDELWSGVRDESHGEGRLLDARGHELWVSVSASLVRDEDGEPALAVVLLEDISGRKAHEQLLAHRALHDPLTDLPNRALFRDRLEHAMRAAHRGHTDLAVLMLDLDGFKEVNDRHGHHAGDRVLIEVARRLIRAVRDSDTVARLGGDEFAVLLPSVGGPEGVEQATAHILDGLRERFDVGGCECEIGASVGGALHPGTGGDVDVLLEAADVAMYAAKRSGADFQLA